MSLNSQERRKGETAKQYYGDATVAISAITFINFGKHCTQKWSFPLRISSVNVTKSAVSCGFGPIDWRNP